MIAQAPDDHAKPPPKRPRKQRASAFRAAPVKQRRRDPALAEDVQLVATKGTKGRGGGPDGESWRIEYRGRRAGQVFINLIDQPPLGLHASIQIYLNQLSQGRGIGKVGYARACAASRFNTIYAHMRKSNLASAGAAAAAGFTDATTVDAQQKLMVWRRNEATIPESSGKL